MNYSLTFQCDASQMDKRGLEFRSLLSDSNNIKNYFDSLYSGNNLIAFSTICDLCPNVRSSIFLSIQSFNSLGMVIVNLTRSFFARDISHGCEHKHINMSDNICDNVIHSVISMIYVRCGAVWKKENC